MVKVLMAGVVLLVGLTACEDMSAVRASSYDQMYEWMHGTPPPKPEPRVIESRYCYKARADILCYDSPQLGKEDQFIGAQ